MTPEEFYQALTKHHINLSAKQKEQFDLYFKLLVEWNDKINLTAITEEKEVYLKHFYDSIAPLLSGYIPNESLKLLDIGAGAGFPSLPMKIIYPQLDVTIIDSLNKRIQLLALKASAADEELKTAQNALNLLFSQTTSSDNYQLPNGDGRNLTIITKKKETPNKYPRKAGMPNKKPL